MAKTRFRNIKAILLIVILVAGSYLLQQWRGSEEIIRINGNQVTIIDGDSFKAGEEEFRIFGIDAPEYRQSCQDASGKQWPCGSESRDGLKQTLAGSEFSCEVRARDRFGRTIVTCMDPTGLDLGSKLVEQGLAVSGHDFDESIYAVDERNAKKARRGIWRGSFARPDVWRSQNPRS